MKMKTSWSLVIISLLTLPLWAGAIEKNELCGSYKIKDQSKNTFFVTLEEDKLILRADESSEDEIEGSWSLESSVLTVSYEMDSEPTELVIDLTNTPISKLQRGTFVESIKRTFDDEEKVTLWMKKTK